MNLRDVLTAEEQESNKTTTEASEDSYLHVHNPIGSIPIGFNFLKYTYNMFINKFIIK
jgi:hypothetical protein